MLGGSVDDAQMGARILPIDRRALDPLRGIARDHASGASEQAPELSDGAPERIAKRPVRLQGNLVVGLPKVVLNVEEVTHLAVLEDLLDGLGVLVRELRVQCGYIVASWGI